MHQLARISILVLVFAPIAISSVAVASEEAYRDCVAFLGVPVGDPKRPEAESHCRKVTKTMEEWKALKRALCVSVTTPPDEQCKEFRTK